VSEPETPTLFEVALYLVCSSRNALDETLGYASMRLLDGAGRLTAAADAAQPDPFLAEMLGRIDETKVKVMHDLGGYTAALEEIQSAFIEEAKRRNSIRQ
jgi:Family of unknown function (DUF6092)